MIRRQEAREALDAAISRSPVTVLVGPRQCGKTTLARELIPADSPNVFDLEDPADLARLEQPKTALEGLEGLVVLDEIQRRPDSSPCCGSWATAPVRTPAS